MVGFDEFMKTFKGLRSYHEKEEYLVNVRNNGLAKIDDLRNPFGSTPLMVFALEKNYQNCDILMNHGADPYTTNNKGYCAMSYARYSRSKRISELFNESTCPRGDIKFMPRWCGWDDVLNLFIVMVVLLFSFYYSNNIKYENLYTVMVVGQIIIGLVINYIFDGFSKVKTSATVLAFYYICIIINLLISRSINRNIKSKTDLMYVQMTFPLVMCLGFFITSVGVGSDSHVVPKI